MFLYFRLQAPELDLDQFAWLTPLRGDISSECLAASNQYVDTLLNIQPDLTSIPGPLSMFDSNGRFPLEGFLSDSLDIPIDICQGDEECQFTLPDQLRFVTAKIPLGYSINPGNFDECLEITDFETAYCNMYIQGPPGFAMARPPGPGRMQEMSTIDVDQLNSLGNINVLQNQHLHPKAKSLTMDLSSINLYVSELAAYNISITTDRLYLSMLSVYSIVASPKIGMCFPKACSVEDVNKNFANLTADSNLPIEITINLNINGTVLNYTLELPSSEVTVNTAKCFTSENIHGTPEEFPPVYIFFYILYALIGALVILGTLSEVVFEFVLKKKAPNSLPIKLIHSYSMYSNGKRLLSTKSIGKDHLDCMNGMRFLSMTWVAVGHSFVSAFGTAIRNSEAGLNILSHGGTFLFEVILNALPSVDSFFLMSGTLTTYIFLKELDRAGKNPIKHTVTLIMYYLHRYLRLTIPYVLIMGVVISVLPFVYHGPEWNNIVLESESCQKYWWKHLLYIHTLVEDNQNDRCMAVTWYLVDDMMFHVFSPVVIYPMYILYKMTKKHLWTVLFWAFSLACFTFGVFYIAYTTEQGPMGVKVDNIHTHYTYHVSFYFAPWARYQAYLIGIILGYILHHCRGKDIKIREDVNIFAWEAAFLGGFAVVFGLHTVRQTNEMTLFAATMYHTFQRLAWNGALAWVIFSCSKGYGGIINEFLSWSAFAPLSRLTFCTYLIHQNVISMFAKSVLSSFPNDFEMFTSVWYYLAIQFISCVVAFGFALVFEVPATRAEKLLVDAVLGSLFKQEPKPQVTNRDPEIRNAGIASTTAQEPFKDENAFKEGEFLNEKELAKWKEANMEPTADTDNQTELASTDSNTSGIGSNDPHSADNNSEETGSNSANSSDGSGNAPPAYDQIIKDVDAIQKA